MSHGFGDIAPTVLNNGYTPIPIRYGTKIPAIPNWQTTDYSTSPKKLKSLIEQFPGSSTGIVLGQVCVIDIDVLDAEAARVCVEIVTAKLGAAPCRVGKPPKKALFFGVQGPAFSKLTPRPMKLTVKRPRLKSSVPVNRLSSLGNTRKPKNRITGPIKAFSMSPLTSCQRYQKSRPQS